MVKILRIKPTLARDGNPFVGRAVAAGDLSLGHRTFQPRRSIEGPAWEVSTAPCGDEVTGRQGQELGGRW